MDLSEFEEGKMREEAAVQAAISEEDKKRLSYSWIIRRRITNQPTSPNCSIGPGPLLNNKLKNESPKTQNQNNGV